MGGSCRHGHDTTQLGATRVLGGRIWQLPDQGKSQQAAAELLAQDNSIAESSTSEIYFGSCCLKNIFQNI
jgi:hypothetical protein